ncbi:MAG: helix-turn-helix domain-containing protein [Deltaproteobacteria bacterium]|nr:MAG: helix-turn-helix domain-containing protein [Deltaproteobacteria bacterium]
MREKQQQASSERGRRPSGDEASTQKKPRRWSSRMKTEAVLRLLRGESLELVSRELGVNAAKLSEWRDAFLAAGEKSLKAQNLRDTNRRIAKLQRKIGELTMEVELLREKARKLEVNAPNFAWRRSRK